MPTIWDPWPGKTNASGDATGQGYQNAPSRSVFRYSHAVAKLRAYRQRERARGRARTHAAIEAATLRESAKRGYAGLRMTEIARRARISPPTVYLHSPSKERPVISIPLPPHYPHLPWVGRRHMHVFRPHPPTQ